VVLFFVFHSTYSGKFSSGISFGPYILSGTLVLSFLATGIVTTTQNLVSSATIFTRLPARPEIFALSSAIVLTLNIFMGIIPLAVWNFIQGGTLSPFIFFVPVEALLGCIFITGLALICFVAVVRIGDVINVINIAATLATYLTPVFYPMNAISARAQLFLNLNPLTHFVNIFRKLTLNYGEARWYDWLYCSGSSVLVFIIGLYILNRTWKQTVTLL